MKPLFFCILCFALSFRVAWAQETHKVYTYNNELQGLPTEVIKAISTDQWGFLWLATDEGLVRFDGKQLFTIPDLPTPYIKNFLIRRNGDHWVLHDRGVHQVFSQPDTAFVRPLIEGSEKKEKNKIFYAKSLFETSDSTVWISENQDILAYRKEKLYRYEFGAEDNADSYVRAYSFFEDKNLNFWAMSYTGNLYCFDKQQDRFERIAAFPKIANVQDVVGINDSIYWVATDLGVYELKIREKKATMRQLKALKSAACLLKISNHEVFVGTWLTGLYKININTEQLVPQNIKPQAINNFYTQNNNVNVWLATNEGFILLQNQFFEAIKLEKSSNFINYLQAYEGKLYATDGSNIHVLCPEGGWVECDRFSGFDIGIISTFRVVPEGIYLMSGTGQFYFYENKTQKTTKISSKVLKHIIADVILDKNNTIWATCPDINTLICIKNNQIEYYSEKEGLFNPIALAENEKGDIFISQKGNNNYLLKYNQAKNIFENISIPIQSNQEIVVQDLDIHKDSIFMATTEGIFVFLLKERQVHKLFLHEYTHESFKAISITKNGSLWVGSSKGVLFYDRKKVVYYNHLSGLPSKSISYRCIQLDQSAQNIFIGTSTGLAIGKNQQENTIRRTQSPVLLKVEVNQTKISNQNLTKYAFQDNAYVKFYFLALDFPREQIFYQYRLLGKDTTWSEFDEKTDFILPPLQNGEYQLEIRANKSGGYLVSDVLKVPFKIFLPWYKTWQAYFAYLLVFLSLLYIAYKINNWRLEMKTRRLEHIISIRTTEINNKNKELELKQQEILVQNEELRQQQEEILTQRDSISHKNQELLFQKEKIEAANTNMALISKIGQEITSTLDLEKAISILYDYINKLMEAEEFGIGTYNPQAQKINFDFYIYQNQRLPFFQSSVADDRFSSWVIREKKAVFFGDIRYEYHNYIKDFSYYENDQLLNSMICTPLMIGEKIIGIMSVQSSKKRAYTDYHFDILQALASYVSIALENTASYYIIEEKNRHITDSIRYAQDIQQAILPTDQDFRTFFEEYFVIFLPKDLVSGDFYWFTQSENKAFVAVVDCTGHGVPGAFMSMIGHTLLNEIINIEKVQETDKVLTLLDTKVREALQQETRRNQDGMDIGLCSIEPFQSRFRVSFSGAKSNLFYTKNDKLEKIKGDRRSIGGVYKKQLTKHFSKHELSLPAGSLLYLYSDGYIDQANPEDKRIGSREFELWIRENHHQKLNEQREFFLTKLKKHQQHTIQRDDITFLGLKL